MLESIPNLDPATAPREAKTVRELTVGMTLAEVLARGDEAPTWLVKDLFLEGGVYIWAGDPKLGNKTWTMMDLSLDVARGRPFLGRPTTQCGVLYGLLEDGPRRAGRRFRLLGASGMEPLDVKVVANAAGLDRALLYLDTHGIKALVIIDTLSHWEFHKGIQDENSALEATGLMAALRAIAERTGSTFVVVHHPALFTQGR